MVPINLRDESIQKKPLD